MYMQLVATVHSPLYDYQGHESRCQVASNTPIEAANLFKTVFVLHQVMEIKIKLLIEDYIFKCPVDFMSDLGNEFRY